MGKVLSGSTYEIREELKSVGAKYNGATRKWTVSDKQFDALVAMAERSMNRFNKKDTAFGRSWQSITIEEGSD